MKKILLLILTVILILGNTVSVFAETMMIPKDGKYIWVDVNSKEAQEYLSKMNGTAPTETTATATDKALEQETLALKKKMVEAEPKEVQAKPTSQKITVDGKLTSFRAYNIGGYNYFMLRDLAYIFNGTKAQFEVGWDGEKFAISLETGKPYTGKGVGFEMKTPHVAEKGYKSRATIYKDGKEAVLLAYTIQGYTYFKLRDLGDEMGFGVKWDDKNQTVVLLSDKDAEMPVVTPDPVEVADKEEEWDPFKDYNPFGVEEVDLSKVKGITESQKQQMREEMLVLINKARKEAGAGPLVLDNNLIKMSEYKATDLKKTGVLSHDGSYGSVLDLARMFNENAVGENVLSGGMSAEHMFTMWWNSPGHKANMMNPKYKRIGIGFAEDRAETVAIAKVYKDLEKLAYKVQYNEVTKLYHISTMNYWAAQNFGF
jgi:uncharacterized protein YkwD/uncharacterized protein YxeA